MRTRENAVSTIPEDILVTSARPDIVLVYEDRLLRIELTIPHNSLVVLSNAWDRKSQKEIYLQAISDLELKGHSSHLEIIEIGSIGHWLPVSQRVLLKAAPSITRQITRKVMDKAACKFTGAFQMVFNARLEKAWTSLPTIASL